MRDPNRLVGLPVSVARLVAVWPLVLAGCRFWQDPVERWIRRDPVGWCIRRDQWAGGSGEGDGSGGVLVVMAGGALGLMDSGAALVLMAPVGSVGALWDH
jgi:hypothetical protein